MTLVVAWFLRRSLSVQAQVGELQAIQRSLFELEQLHTSMTQEYREEVNRLRQLLPNNGQGMRLAVLFIPHFSHAFNVVCALCVRGNTHWHFLVAQVSRKTICIHVGLLRLGGWWMVDGGWCWCSPLFTHTHTHTNTHTHTLSLCLSVCLSVSLCLSVCLSLSMSLAQMMCFRRKRGRYRLRTVRKQANAQT
jgi:Tup N-terminal